MVHWGDRRCSRPVREDTLLSAPTLVTVTRPGGERAAHLGRGASHRSMTDFTDDLNDDQIRDAMPQGSLFPGLGPCRHPEAHLALSGQSKNVGMWCPTCKEWVTKALGIYTDPWIPKHHEAMRGVDRDELPRVLGAPQQCAICLLTSNVGEEHHWCPQALYRDHPPPNGGPTAWLCTPCHKEWHERVTPGLCG